MRRRLLNACALLLLAGIICAVMTPIRLVRWQDREVTYTLKGLTAQSMKTEP